MCEVSFCGKEKLGNGRFCCEGVLPKSRLSSLTIDGQTQASKIIYNAASQTSSLTVGASTANPVNEAYGYNAQTGLLESQTVAKAATPNNYLLNLSYDYADANGKRTGQLTKIYNNLDRVNKDRGFEYDALGRLVRATGGQGTNNIWVQKYEYDRYGNRSNVYSYVLEDYVKNFYQSALNRQPNSTELNQWLTSLRAAYQQGLWQFRDAMRNLGATLFTSSEYIARGRTNEQFVYDLYKAFLYREPDPDGFAYWVSVVPTNGRDNVRLGFELSVEFYTKVFGTSPYAPSGSAVPADGLQGIAFDQATNRIANSGWNYDAAGNQTRTFSNGVWQRHQYDAANRLVRVKDDNQTVIASYTYGADNQRLVTEEFAQGTSTRTYYVAEGLSGLAEYVENGGAVNPSWAKSYVYLGNRLLSTMTPNGAAYHHPDRLGTRIITNPSTGGSSEQATLPFGTALAAESSGTSSNRRFTSYDRSDTTKLDYAVNRHYDSQQGRFTQVDPAGMKATSLLNPQTLNLYAYVANDPVNRTDADGLGLISFFKKIGRWIKKHWKIILVAVAVAVAVLLIPGAPSFLGSFFQNAGTVVLGAAAEGGGIPTWLKVVFGGAIAAGIAGLGVLAQQKKPSMWVKSEEQAFDRLERLLKKGGACAEFLGAHGLDALKAMRNAPRFTLSSGPGNNPTGISMDLPAFNGNFRTPNRVTFFTNGPFFIGVNKPALGTFPAGSNAAQLVALMHELGHLVKNAAGTGPLLPTDGGNSTLSQTNTDTMLNFRGKNGKTCKEEIFDAK